MVLSSDKIVTLLRILLTRTSDARIYFSLIAHGIQRTPKKKEGRQVEKFQGISSLERKKLFNFRTVVIAGRWWKKIFQRNC